MAIVRWEPTREVASMEVDRLNRMFENLYNDAFSRTWTPAVDIYETADHQVVVKVELPGVSKDEVKIVMQENMLTIRGEKKQEMESKGSNYRKVERSYGSFQRSFTLPSTVKGEKIEASFKDGVLSISLPKAEEARRKEIEVKVK